MSAHAIDPVTRAAGAAYAEVLRRRTQRGWIVVPGPADDRPAAVQQLYTSFSAEKDQDSLANISAEAAA